MPNLGVGADRICPLEGVKHANTETQMDLGGALVAGDRRFSGDDHRKPGWPSNGSDATEYRDGVHHWGQPEPDLYF